jgi:hypothetical protein
MNRLFRSSLGFMLCLSPFAVVSELGVGSTLGCSNCPPARPPERFKGGYVHTDGFYETSQVRAEMLPFPAGSAYEIEHQLGLTPVSVLPYISFVARPYESGDDVTLASGNLTLIEGWDERVIVVRNDTCSDFYIRVVAEAPSRGGLGGAIE